MTEDKLTARTAAEEYLNQLTGVCQSTEDNHRSRLNHFVEWCEEEGITNVGEVNERKLIQYRAWRKGDVASITLRMEFGTIRKFIRYCEQIGVVTQGVSANVDLPAVPKGEDVCDDLLTQREADAIMDYFKKFEYASRAHVIFTLLWDTGMRLSTLHSLDVDDLDYEQKSLRVRHRSSEGTSLKNRQWGERTIALTESSCEVIRDYLRYHHIDSEDEYGRVALITTDYGRAHRTTITKEVYKYTRPCCYQLERAAEKKCPDGRELGDCEATRNDQASKCPFSVSPHAIRRGSLTNQLQSGWPHKALSDRANVSVEILSKHYDKATEEEKAERRRRYLSE